LLDYFLIFLNNSNLNLGVRSDVQMDMV